MKKNNHDLINFFVDSIKILDKEVHGRIEGILKFYGEISLEQVSASVAKRAKEIILIDERFLKILHDKEQHEARLEKNLTYHPLADSSPKHLPPLLVPDSNAPQALANLYPL